MKSNALGASSSPRRMSRTRQLAPARATPQNTVHMGTMRRRCALIRIGSNRKGFVVVVAHKPPRIAKANGIDICYEMFGEPGAEPLVLIMGLAGQMVQWD